MPTVPQHVAEQASNIQGLLNGQIRLTRDDKTLSDVGRRQRMAHAYLDAEREMTSLKESWETTAETTSVVLAKGVFGAANTTGVDAISVRDADDRAAQLTSMTEALELLTRAEENGDAVLSRAVAQRAHREQGGFEDFGGGWSQVLDAYTATHRDVAEKLEELNNARRQSVANNLYVAMVFSLSKPRELDGISNLEGVAYPSDG